MHYVCVAKFDIIENFEKNLELNEAKSIGTYAKCSDEKTRGPMRLHVSEKSRTPGHHRAFSWKDAARWA